MAWVWDITPFELAHQMGLGPIVWLTALWSAGRSISARWWGLGAAFAVSWVADWVSHWTSTFPVGPPYLFIQAGLVALLLAPRPTAWRFVLVLFGATALAMTRFDPHTPDIFVHTVAWLGLLTVLWPLPLGRLRLTFAVAFGLGWLAWLSYCARPGWASWLTYQGVRAASLGLFCWAAWNPAPLHASA